MEKRVIRLAEKRRTGLLGLRANRWRRGIDLTRKDALQPRSAAEMASLWVTEIRTRQAQVSTDA